jgi:hypothetical protein
LGLIISIKGLIGLLPIPELLPEIFNPQFAITGGYTTKLMQDLSMG